MEDAAASSSSSRNAPEVLAALGAGQAKTLPREGRVTRGAGQLIGWLSGCVIK
jgi:hypothetical protein